MPRLRYCQLINDGVDAALLAKMLLLCARRFRASARFRYFQHTLISQRHYFRHARAAIVALLFHYFHYMSHLPSADSAAAAPDVDAIRHAPAALFALRRDIDIRYITRFTPDMLCFSSLPLLRRYMTLRYAAMMPPALHEKMARCRARVDAACCYATYVYKAPAI